MGQCGNGARQDRTGWGSVGLRWLGVEGVLKIEVGWGRKCAEGCGTGGWPVRDETAKDGHRVGWGQWGEEGAGLGWRRALRGTAEKGLGVGPGGMSWWWGVDLVESCGALKQLEQHTLTAQTL